MEEKTYLRSDSVIECSCGCGHKPTENALYYLNQLARYYATLFNKQLYVTSGARCFRHNVDVGGSPNSAHIRGLAFDVAFSNSRECYAIINELYILGIKRIGINFAKNFIHFDIDIMLPQNVLFKY